jgi:hypothetical protein
MSDILDNHIELNMSNYDEDGVSALNQWALDAYDEIKRLREERYRLSFAITGGEDAPGLLDSLPVEQLVDIARDSARAHNATIDECEKFREALTKIAAYDDAAASAYLRATGSYAHFDEPKAVEIARTALEDRAEPSSAFRLRDMVRKKSGSWWEGRVVGFYSTEQTPDGVCVQLDKPMGPVQIYPASALELVQ